TSATLIPYVLLEEKYEHVGPKVIISQDDKRSHDDDLRLCVADDLMKAQDHITRQDEGTCSSLKTELTTTYYYKIIIKGEIVRITEKYMSLPMYREIARSESSSNGLERLPTGSISTWEDLTTYFLAQFFPPKRTSKLRNDILMLQQHQGESLSEAWTRFKDLLQKSLTMASIFGSKSKSSMIMSIRWQAT
ncbi:zinc finger, CCHC-type containing protein, partial [Tanacetum coccineum]